MAVLADRAPSVLFVYTDGGPDHNNSFASMQLVWLAVMCLLNLDLLMVGRCAPTQSWANPMAACPCSTWVCNTNL
jgi:hypothetical protein